MRTTRQRQSEAESPHAPHDKASPMPSRRRHGKRSNSSALCWASLFCMFTYTSDVVTRVSWQ
jgi:hypothetical protein